MKKGTDDAKMIFERTLNNPPFQSVFHLALKLPFRFGKKESCSTNRQLSAVTDLGRPNRPNTLKTQVLSRKILIGIPIFGSQCVSLYCIAEILWIDIQLVKAP